MARIGELLAAEGLLTPEQLDQALRAQVMWGGRLGTILIELGFIGLDGLSVALGRQHRLPAALAHHFEMADRALQMQLAADIAERFTCVPLYGIDPDRVVVASYEPLDPRATGIIAGGLGVRPAQLYPAIAAELRIRYQLERVYRIPRQTRFLRAPNVDPAAIPRFEGLEGLDENTPRPSEARTVLDTEDIHTPTLARGSIGHGQAARGTRDQVPVGVPELAEKREPSGKRRVARGTHDDVVSAPHTPYPSPRNTPMPRGTGEVDTGVARGVRSTRDDLSDRIAAPVASASTAAGSSPEHAPPPPSVPDLRPTKFDLAAAAAAAAGAAIGSFRTPGAVVLVEEDDELPTGAIVTAPARAAAAPAKDLAQTINDDAPPFDVAAAVAAAPASTRAQRPSTPPDGLPKKTSSKTLTGDIPLRPPARPTPPPSPAEPARVSASTSTATTATSASSATWSAPSARSASSSVSAGAPSPSAPESTVDTTAAAPTSSPMPATTTAGTDSGAIWLVADEPPDVVHALDAAATPMPVEQVEQIDDEPEIEIAPSGPRTDVFSVVDADGVVQNTDDLPSDGVPQPLPDALRPVNISGMLARVSQIRHGERRSYVPTTVSVGKVSIKRVAPTDAIERTAPRSLGATIGEAARAIRRSASRELVVDHVLRTIATFIPDAAAAAVLLVRGDVAISGGGYDRRGATLPEIIIPLGEPGLVPSVLHANATLRAADAELGVIDQFLFEALADAGPGELVVAPISVAGVVIGVILLTPEPGGELVGLDSIAAAAGAAFARLMRDAGR